MYVPPLYRNDDRGDIADFLRERAFGLVVVCGEEGPHGVHVPFAVDAGAGGDLRLRFHVARANGLWRQVEDGRRLLLSVSGPDAYVSPDWYVAADQVPTWNYVAVHCVGAARIIPDQEVGGLLSDLSLEQERRLLPKRPWTLDKLSPSALERLLKAIVGIEMTVDGIEGQWKLSQNKRDADRDGVLAGLDARGDAGSIAVAALMRRHRRRP